MLPYKTSTETKTELHHLRFTLGHTIEARCTLKKEGGCHEQDVIEISPERRQGALQFIITICVYVCYFHKLL